MRYFPTRLINQLRCWGSYALSIIGVQRVRHLPVFVSVEPANFCQLACPECPVGRRHRSATPDKRHVLSRELWTRILAQAAPTVHTVQFFFQGEPLLCNDLPEMIREAHKEGIYTIVSTNAQRLDEQLAQRLVDAGLDRIIVSMDGWTQQTYEQYRQGGSIEQCRQAIRLLRRAKDNSRSRMVIELQCLRLKTNEHEWEQFRQGYRALGADRLTMKTAQLYDYAHGSTLMPSDTRYTRYRYDTSRGEYVPKRPLHNHCYRLWSGCVIDVQGNVLPCCYDKGGQHSFGNITQQSLAEVWHSTAADIFRKQVLTRRDTIPICTNCNE